MGYFVTTVMTLLVCGLVVTRLLPQDPAPPAVTCDGDGCKARVFTAIPSGLQPRVQGDPQKHSGSCECDGPDCAEVSEDVECRAHITLTFDFSPNGAIVFDENEVVIYAGNEWVHGATATADCSSDDEPGQAQEEIFYVYIEEPPGSGEFVLYEVKIRVGCAACYVFDPDC